MSRSYCKDCTYPIVTCVCKSISSVELPISVLVLQHNKEASHAKNTIRLAKLITPAIEVINSASGDEVIKRLSTLKPEETLVLYPTINSHAIEDTISERHKFNALIILDGSWKQVFSIWKIFPILHKFHQVHFRNPPSKSYRIRKSKKHDQLSSIEALAYSIEMMTKIDTSAYLKALAHLQDHWDGQSSNKSSTSNMNLGSNLD